jgi:hypothetical protein
MRMLGTARVVPPGDPGYPRLWRLVNEANKGRYDQSRPGPAARSPWW